MKIQCLAFASFALCVTGLCAQEKPQEVLKTEAKVSTEAEHKDLPVSVKLLLVVAAYDGEKKVSSVPYTMYLEAFEHAGPATKIRLQNEYYLCCRKDGELEKFKGDTNIDVRAKNLGDGRFEVSGVMIRNWPESNDSSGSEKGATPTGPASKPEMPTTKVLQAEFNLLMRDGQTLQAVNATDSGTGRVLTVTATINVIK